MRLAHQVVMRLAAGVVLVAAASTMAVASAAAESTTQICVPEAASKPVLSANAKGECPPKGTKVPVTYKSVTLPGPGGLETLSKILPHMNYVEKGIAGQPTIQFSSVNVQVVSGSGKTDASPNGMGNLVIGYDENAVNHQQTGSHYLILGEEQTFTSYAGILGGRDNAITAPFASVSGGYFNVVSGPDSSISGGAENTAGGEHTSVSGGSLNSAFGPDSSISGGDENTALGEGSSVSGGRLNSASGNFASIFGGVTLHAAGAYEAIP
jgi:hypothetical protein